MTIKSQWNAENVRDLPGSGKSHGKGNGNPLWYSFVENPMNRGAWQTMVHGVAESQKRLKWLSMHIHMTIKNISSHCYVSKSLLILNISISNNSNNCKITKGFLCAIVQRAFTAFLMKSFITVWDCYCYYPHLIGKETEAWKITCLRSVTGTVGQHFSPGSLTTKTALIMIVPFWPFFLVGKPKELYMNYFCSLTFSSFFHSHFIFIIIVMYIKIINVYRQHYD